MILVFAPHPDDEVLGCYNLIYNAIQQHKPVKIVYVTNGGHHGYKDSNERYIESCRAMNLAGLSQEDMIWMGYPDTGGMNWEHSFQLRLLQNPGLPYSGKAEKMQRAYRRETDYGQYTEQYDVYCLSDILNDFAWLFLQFKPRVVVIPHPLDRHADHLIIHWLAQTMLQALPLTHDIQVLSYLVHGGDDSGWPNEGVQFDVPPVLRCLPNVWNNRTSFACGELEREKKEIAIKCFQSQLCTDERFLLSFAKLEEIYWESIIRATKYGHCV